MPGLSGVTTKSPRSLVMTVRDRFVAVSVTTTVAWGMEAFDGSCTLPTMRPVLTWAAAVAASGGERMATARSG